MTLSHETGENVSLSSSALCPDEGRFPTLAELQIGLGSGGSSVLLTCVILVLIINAAMFFTLLARFVKNIPQSQIPNTLWVTSLFSVTSFVLTLMVYLPKSTEFLMASFRVYEAMVISRFIELSLMWYGGENKLMNSLPEGATVRYNLPPLCCCFFCLNNKLITRKRIKIFRFLSAQMIHIQILMLFIQLVMVSCGVQDHHPTVDNPHTFVKFFGRISFLFGFWALFVFFKIEHTHKLLDGSKYIAKFSIMKFFFVLFLLQETIVELVSSNGVIACLPPYISGKSKGFLVFAGIVMIEALIFGMLQFYYYYRYPVAKLNGYNSKEENEMELKNSNGV